MKKENVYKLIIAILLFINLLQLASFLLAPKPQQHPNDRFQDRIIQTLNLNDEQQKTFHSYAKEHAEHITTLLEQQTQIINQYFKNPSDDLLHEISAIESKKITATAQHFFNIKSILKPNQLQNFEAFKKLALQHILGNEEPKSRPPH
ncbi:hypothetical protein KO500_11635 [Cellulophaga baltica]|uniref:hypothetical protein n=1 Tax=Cellulophaga TaxID=104264 RepID=UPI001C073950|nr:MULTISPECIES: hypothetical protein [Cellulophaga]MBU2997090.1 hypothetical protein [Cellulophaga baltica]MDO6768488.1 hypothetical protein [Cellulophaga sp. 1_MG-2023]